MMRYIFCLVIASFAFACNESTTETDVTQTSDSSIIEQRDSTDEVINSDNNNDGAGPGGSPDQSFLPGQLQGYLQNEFTDWTVPGRYAWENTWWTRYQKDNSRVGYIPADFNCDGKQDYALLLTNKKDTNTVAAWAFVAGNDSYTEHKLYEYKRVNRKIPVGVQKINPGKLPYMDESGGGNNMQLKCDAVQVVYFETAARTWYWKDGKFSYVQTGD